MAQIQGANQRWWMFFRGWAGLGDSHDALNRKPTRALESNHLWWFIRSWQKVGLFRSLRQWWSGKERKICCFFGKRKHISSFIRNHFPSSYWEYQLEHDELFFKCFNDHLLHIKEKTWVLVFNYGKTNIFSHKHHLPPFFCTPRNHKNISAFLDHFSVAWISLQSASFRRGWTPVESSNPVPKRTGLQKNNKNKVARLF